MTGPVTIESRRSSTTTSVIAGATAVVFVYLARRILLPFVMAAIVAFLCTPLVNWARLRTVWPRWLVSWALLILLAGCATLLGWLLVPALLRDVVSVSSNLEGAIQRLFRGLLGDRGWTILNFTVDAPRLSRELINWLRLRAGADTVLAVGALGAAGFFGFFLFWVLLAYFLVDEPRISAGLQWLVPPERRPFARRVWKDLGPILRRYFGGVALIVAYTTVMAYLGLGWFLGLHHALLLALLTGMLELIPMIGPLAAAVLAGLVAIGEASGPTDVIAYIGYAVALRLSIDQLVGPIVLGRAGRVHPVLVIFCFLAGGTLFGITGVILSVPVALALKSILALRYEGTP